ncbi:uncharacterized protein Z520_09353 [Fonsecaea multimorphosa CBS 102226]|uniref:T6SS Phospholipase effector Tle1-like catalytic domain-containing protein n=1 Tax=Fonsecaea multimorphosa CBS 102226 TaxID=1442371 RepID=A0A0D2KEA7_9EURO|nr:uncharacterized protein Z520_09353 [Fonsecaea multimorphosa CBS 102226]KIX95043.1 hypothetical protein Z520_09353 [Fonsecaea multimorphosa CBS 102226]OAL20687.1 hypothetical protein AYO22_08696 [Fonsecaea multimorphosa]
MAAPDPDQPRQKSVFVLCFDGTGNKFSGKDTDSNILKLYRMLDRTDVNMYTFYQPGIGTYVSSHSIQTTSTLGRIRSWYLKAIDEAVGTSFADHVMGGYKFLMRYYSCEDDLYFFGFSRGAYTARFLAEMLDHIGLLAAGNEELIRFAWKTYAKWAARKNDGSDKAKMDEEEQYEFMRGFRETFSRPVRRIRFLGLFDTVNSVPRFESAWMQRSKFPYTARPSAKVIRHAVSIDERRAKFRQDLITGPQGQAEDQRRHDMRRYESDLMQMNEKAQADEGERAHVGQGGPKITLTTTSGGQLSVPAAQLASQSSSESLAAPMYSPSTEHLRERAKSPRKRTRRRWSQPKRPQDVQEVWFAGGHGDIGGGWEKGDKEHWMLSHTPLVWMVHEAENAGLKFDPGKMARLGCSPHAVDEFGERIEDTTTRQSFQQNLENCYAASTLHDCLTYNGGLPRGTVCFWKLMEYLPFRRMDLQDGKWKAIRWPLPMGETRDIPDDAQIHISVIRRMQADPTYRPGNLIVGGGGRGVRRAPEKYGIGKWESHMWEGDIIKHTFVRKRPSSPD